MDTLAYEVEPFFSSLAVNELEVAYPLKEQLVCCIYLFLGDRVLADYPDSSDELTEMGVIEFREDIVEDARSRTIDVVDVLPGLVTT